MIKKIALKAFVQVGVANDVESAYQVLVTCAGLGGLDTNTVVVPLFYNQPPNHQKSTVRRSTHQQVTPDAPAHASDVSGGSGANSKEGREYRSNSHYSRMAEKLTNVEPIVTPQPTTRKSPNNQDENAFEGKEQELSKVSDVGDDIATPVAKPETNGATSTNAGAIQTAEQWVSILKDTLLLDRNVIVECNFHKMQVDQALPLRRRFVRGPQDKLNAKFIDAWLNCNILIGAAHDEFVESVYKAARIHRRRQQSEMLMAQQSKREPAKKATTFGVDETDEVDGDSPESALEKGQDEPEVSTGEEGGVESEDVTLRDHSAEELDQNLQIGLSFKDSASLLLQLAYILQKSRRWVGHSKLRVNFVYSNEHPDEFDDEVLEVRAELGDMCGSVWRR